MGRESLVSQVEKEKSLELMYCELSRQVEFSRSEWQQLQSHLTVKSVPAKSPLQSVGEYCFRHYFIVQGLARLYYISPEGKELNKGFYGENYIVGSLSAVVLNEPCRFAVETLEPCLAVEIPVNIGDYMDDTSSWDKLFNHSCQMMMARNERREAELLTMTTKQRFLQFVRNFPGYLERIPQYHIASYLGVTPVALSKYKKQWLEEASS
jgi:CRP-like cAMP-binding protein